MKNCRGMIVSLISGFARVLCCVSLIFTLARHLKRVWLWTSKLHAIAFTRFSCKALNNSPRTTNYNCFVAPKLSQIFVHLITNICSILLCVFKNENRKYSWNIATVSLAYFPNPSNPPRRLFSAFHQMLYYSHELQIIVVLEFIHYYCYYHVNCSSLLIFA